MIILLLSSFLIFPVFSLFILFRFFIYGYRVMPTAWVYVYILSLTISYVLNLYTLQVRNRKLKMIKFIGVFLVLLLSIISGYLLGWNLGVLGAEKITNSLYEGWIEPEWTLDGALCGAFAGLLLSIISVSLSREALNLQINQTLANLVGGIPSITTIISCSLILFVFKYYYYLSIFLVGIIFSLSIWIFYQVRLWRR